MPDYTDRGYSEPMGQQLRHLVEQQLLRDLQLYGIETTGWQFDWSESCGEGHSSYHLDGYLENYSGIALYNSNDAAVADGWVDFIHEGSFFLAYWQFLNVCTLDVYEGTGRAAPKSRPGIPDHVWQQIPTDISAKYQKDRLKQPPFSRA
jgi:hypothetical protein